MNNQKLHDYFQQIGFSSDTLDRIVSTFKLQTFEKDELVVTEGKISKHIGFVESGLFQYYVVKEGEEITSYVNVENTWLASVMSFVGEKPSLENIRALAKGAVFMISKTDLRKLVEEIPAFKNFYIALWNNPLSGSMKVVMTLLCYRPISVISNFFKSNLICCR